jgi:hypothetical protein
VSDEGGDGEVAGSETPSLLCKMTRKTKMRGNNPNWRVLEIFSTLSKILFYYRVVIQLET